MKSFAYSKSKLSNLFKNQDMIIAFLLSLLMFAIAAVFCRLDIDPHHDGIILKPAIDVLNSKILFKETFTQYGAFFVYFQAIAMAVFGKELIVIKLLTCVMYAVTTFFLYKCWRFFLPKTLTVISTIIFIGMAPFYLTTFLAWSSVYAMAETVIIIFLLFKFLEKKNYINIFLAGSLSSLAFYTRQPVGITLFIAIVFLLINFKIFFYQEVKLYKLLGNYFLGVILIIFIFSLYFILTDSFKDWYIQSVRFAYRFGFGTNFVPSRRFFSNLFSYHLIPRYQRPIWSVMPIVCVLLFLNFYTDKFLTKNFRVKLINAASRKEMQLLSFVVIAISSWHQYYPVTCHRHIYWAAGIMIGIFIYFIWNVIKEMDILKKSVLVILIIISLFYNEVRIRINHGIGRYDNYPVTIDYGYHLNGMKVDQVSYDFYKEFYEYVDYLAEKFPEKKFINFTVDGLYGTTFKDNLTNMHVNWGDGIYDDDTLVLQELIDKHKPIIISSYFTAPLGYDLVKAVGDHYLMFFFMDTQLLHESYPNKLFVDVELVLTGEDIVGRITAEPDGSLDGMLKISLNEEKVIKSVLIQIYDQIDSPYALHKTVRQGGWESADNRDFGSAFLYLDGMFVNKEKVTNLNFALKPNVEYGIIFSEVEEFFSGIDENIKKILKIDILFNDDSSYSTIIEPTK